MWQPALPEQSWCFPCLRPAACPRLPLYITSPSAGDKITLPVSAGYRGGSRNDLSTTVSKVNTRTTPSSSGITSAGDMSPRTEVNSQPTSPARTPEEMPAMIPVRMPVRSFQASRSQTAQPSTRLKTRTKTIVAIAIEGMFSRLALRGPYVYSSSLLLEQGYRRDRK